MTAPTISIIGSALTGNMGAVAMLESTFANLRERLPGVRFVLFSVYPAEDRAANAHPDVEIVEAAPRQLGVTINLLALAYRCLPFLRPLLRRRSRAIGALAASSVLLDQGGITFSDGREKYLLYNVASVLPALFVGVPVVKCAQAVGPFRRRLNRTVARAVLPRMTRIFTRGRITHELASGLGLRNLEASADLAFTLPLTEDARRSTGLLVDLSPFDATSVVGFAPSSVIASKLARTGRDHVAESVELVQALLDSGRTVALVPHSARRRTDSTHNNDLPLCRDIAARIGPHPRVLLIDQELGAEQLRVVIGRCGVFLSSRFHAMVSALAMEVPTLVVGWNHKYQEVLEMFGLEEWALGFGEAEPAVLVERLRDLESRASEVRAKIAERLPDVRRLAARQLDWIAESVGHRD